MDPDPARTRWSPACLRGSSPLPAVTCTRRSHHEPRRCRGGRRRSAPAAARRRSGRARPRRGVAAGVRLHRPGDDRGRRTRESAPHHPRRARHRRAGARCQPRRLDRELHQSRRHGDPRAAGCRAPRGRTVQRRDRLRATVRGRARGRARAVELDHVGLNHLSWELGVRVRHADGTATEVLDRLLDEHGEASSTRPSCRSTSSEPNGSSRPTTSATTSSTTSSSSERAPRRRGRSKWPRSRANCSTLYADPELTEKPAQLAQRGGAYYSEAAIGLLSSLLGTGPVRDHIVNVRNQRTLPFLDAEAVIETRARSAPARCASRPCRPSRRSRPG